jgi:hypothetical protein
MKKAPYSLEEAQKLCAEYQYLVGQAFGKEKNSVIECVTIVPFDELSRERFLIFYFLLNNAESALAYEYKGLLFDALVIARSTTDVHELLQEELVTWLAENKHLEAAAEKSVSAS